MISMPNIVRLFWPSEDMSFRWTRKKKWTIVRRHAVEALIWNNRRAVWDIHDEGSSVETLRHLHIVPCLSCWGARTYILLFFLHTGTYPSLSRLQCNRVLCEGYLQVDLASFKTNFPIAGGELFTERINLQPLYRILLLHRLT